MERKECVSIWFSVCLARSHTDFQWVILIGLTGRALLVTSGQYSQEATSLLAATKNIPLLLSAFSLLPQPGMGMGQAGLALVCSPGPAGAQASVTSLFLISCEPFRRQETLEVGWRRRGGFSGRKR